MRMNAYWTGKVARIVGKKLKGTMFTPSSKYFQHRAQTDTVFEIFFSFTMSDYG